MGSFTFYLEFFSPDIVGTFHSPVSFLVYAKGESSNAGVLKSYLKKQFSTLLYILMFTVQILSQ